MENITNCTKLNRYIGTGYMIVLTSPIKWMQYIIMYGFKQGDMVSVLYTMNKRSKVNSFFNNIRFE